MTILSAQSILARVAGAAPRGRDAADWRLDIRPFEGSSKQASGLSYGLTAAGYDIRAGDLGSTARGRMRESLLLPPGDFKLIASLEWVWIPHDLQVIVHDKSTWARQGLALQNTVLEPGWNGHITLELSNHGKQTIRIMRGQPIGQLVFHLLDCPTERPYTGKYQNQGAKPVEAKFMEDVDGEV
jgi:dCTP deaminase